MFDWQIWVQGLGVIAVLALAAWGFGTWRRNVTIVDCLWSVFFLAATIYYVQGHWGPRQVLITTLVAVWSLRLAGYLAVRSFGKPEDPRYQKIRRDHEPGFAWKSLYLIFGLQALLAWIISLPLFAAAQSPLPLGLLDYLGALLWVIGFAFEAVGDAQLATFKADPGNRGKVMDRGFWRYTRHPNYFGECCLWWGYYLIAVGSGGWWSIPAPLLMTFLLLKVSGVSLLEKDIGDRRPGYADYIARTPAFFPGLPKARSDAGAQR
jgi:steroid 5-alpha reductase family enzyme